MATVNEIVMFLEPSSGTIGDGVGVAGFRLKATEAVPGLPFLRPGFITAPGESRSLQGAAGASLPGFPMPALLGDTATEVDCRVAAEGISVRATGFGGVVITAGGRQLRWRPIDVLARERPELILGPGLVLALALQGSFCLHASAVLGPKGAVLFAGPSGAGKSTLAARLSEQHGFRRLTDDITPFTVDGSGCTVLPHFPQLKLPPESQHPADAPASYPLALVLLLAECDREASVREEPVSPSVAALSVCGHAVASRLFPGHLMAELLRASATVVEKAPVRRLLYPKRPGSITEVASLLEPA